jgi:hypothetical protein
MKKLWNKVKPYLPWLLLLPLLAIIFGRKKPSISSNESLADRIEEVNEEEAEAVKASAKVRAYRLKQYEKEHGQAADWIEEHTRVVK